ncbi:glutathione S-transferase family protein [Mesorhizobium sp. CN2-181]|uniref:glutathione S-transferase family protein n=1 Tax=Mesorhizobium yinganensis TaxID=3157707 RepID=UPI0032B844A5
MALKLYYHPLASFCHKVLIPLYENGTAFQPIVVDFGDPDSAAAFKAVWPMAKMPVLVDEERGATVAESTIVIEYLDAFHPGPVRFIPQSADAAWRVRFWDRFFDHYVHEPMQRIVADALRPQGKRDLFGVEQSRAQLAEAYAFLESELGEKTWVAGEDFSLGDCAAAPALMYGHTLVPIAENQKRLRAYYGRLLSRPSIARVFSEAEPYFRFFPLPDKPVLAPPDV